MATNNLIDNKFAQLREQGRSALIPFLTIGDPDLATSVDIIQALEEAGADMIELGVPYSDPLADGPVIQRASERALKNGSISVADVIQVAENARNIGVKLPFILFTYYNPVLQYGLESFFKLVIAKGISGLIIPDLPIEEDSEVREMAEEAGIHLIPLVAPTSNDRVARIASKARGFVYCVSSLGVTGVRADFHKGIDDFLSTVRSATSIPIAVGFGISSREQVERFEKQADGVIVGSAIVRKIEEVVPLLQSKDTKKEGLAQIRDFVRALKGE
ncbi:tryptophan synthase alpha chain [Paenibacillus baekrokdamisoli]|uniref:Tryptophan synthase alpha chain n=1 Tax=Paenibacillus baekrokdamisoli TaxID=1712516 RepID=A0A3G9IQ36_9BACL|nr:tryptophan synthase subunit alpha [Paenibacillus baekrokdamisoli]MBB3069666.1 tryptophan synthase alpha chain [Paenibacillus baekrokdamisoli]BBH20980.1 tryptophan synthase alpha chain [Paenibacillus baekrokdamisoli]